MKWVCLRAAFTSIAPPLTMGLLAMKPTTWPCMRARQVITALPKVGWISKVDPVSAINRITRRMS